MILILKIRKNNFQYVMLSLIGYSTFLISTSFAALEKVNCELIKKKAGQRNPIGYLYVNKNSDNLNQSKFLQFYVMHKDVETNKMITDKEIPVSKKQKNIIRRNKDTKAVVYRISAPVDGDGRTVEDYQCLLTPDTKI